MSPRAQEKQGKSSTDSKPKSKEQRVHGRYKVGDIELMSSDDVLFRVKSMYLAVGSRVFRTMIEDDNTKAGPIALTDRDCERSKVLEIFLDLLHGGALPQPQGQGTISRIEAVITLARKYDCPGMIYTISHVLRGAVLDESFEQLEIFIILSQLGDVNG